MKKIKICIIFLFAALFLQVKAHVVVYAEEMNNETIVEKGTCGENVNWYRTMSGELRISGTGAIENNWIITEQLMDCYEAVETVVIEEGITRIGEEAFSCYGDTGTFPYRDSALYGGKDTLFSNMIKEITLPSTVTEIGKYAFLSNKYLKNIYFASNSKLKSIHYGAFNLCEALEKIKIPDTVSLIDDYAFCNCYSLKEISLPDAIDTIHSCVFDGCKSLQKIDFSATHIEGSAFHHCESLESIVLPEGTVEIGGGGIIGGTFAECTNLKSITLPVGLKKLYAETFRGCTSLENVLLPDTLETIGYSTFSGCTNLKELSIPASVTFIGVGILADCINIENVYFYGNLPEQELKFQNRYIEITTDEEHGYGYLYNAIYYFPDIFAPGIQCIVNDDLSITIGKDTVYPDSEGYYIYDGLEFCIYKYESGDSNTDYGWSFTPRDGLVIGSFSPSTDKNNISIASSYITSLSIPLSKKVTAYYPLGKKNWTASNRNKISKLAQWKSFNPYGYSEKVKVSKISLSSISKKIAAGKKVSLKAQVYPRNASNKALTWKSSNKKIATVNSRGIVTFKKRTGGKSVRITATAKDKSGKKVTIVLKSMKGIVKSIKIKGAKTVKNGRSIQLKASVKATKGANKTLKWISSNTKYARVTSKGRVIAVKKVGKGKKVKITAMAIDGSNQKKIVTVKIK